MASRTARPWAWVSLLALYALRNDWWFWDDPSRFLGLPVGLTYHILSSAAVVLVMWWLVRVAWPADALERLAVLPEPPNRAAAQLAGDDRETSP